MNPSARLRGWRRTSRRRDDWQAALAASIVSAEALAAHLPVDAALVARVASRYPLRITPHMLSLIQRPGDAIWRQVVPDERELIDDALAADPLGEIAGSALPGVIHRYPDRVLLTVTHHCAVYCRHCLRKRMVGDAAVSPERLNVARALAYIRRRPAIREVILSGGDPLMLPDERLAALLTRLRSIRHVATIRIHSRMPCALPQRITPSLVHLLRRFHPLWFVTQFNHPQEICAAAAAACRRLVDAGIPLACQSVLLRGVNDEPQVLAELMRALTRMRIQPYYLHHADPVAGTGHFRTATASGLSIMRALRRQLSGWPLPCYVADQPDGGGKALLSPGAAEPPL